MRRPLSMFAAVLISASAVAAHADTINGTFNAYGNDSFTSSSINFGTTQVAGTIPAGTTFATYLTDGNPVTFLPGALPYVQGVNMPPASTFPAGFVPIFSTAENGETFTFDMTQYDATLFAGTNSTFGCSSGSTCLSITGLGYFTGSGELNGTSGPATFEFTSQYAPGDSTPDITTFSASTTTTEATAITPEPSSIALLGTGLLGVAGICRRKFAL